MSKIRVQLDLREKEVRALDLLKDRCDLKSRADAVRVSLGILEWVAQQSAAGNQIVSVGANSVAPLIILGLTDSLRKTA